MQLFSRKISARESLIIGVIFVFLIWYVQWLWNRRKLYIYSFKIEGPFSIPIIGSAFTFIGSTGDIFENIQHLFKKYPKTLRVWFGPRLFYGVQDAVQADILLNKALAKEKWYRNAEPFMGHGLITAPVNVWKKHRKLINPTFNQKILDGFVEVFSEKSEILVQQLESKCDVNLDIFIYFSRATLDSVCETAMGVQINAQTSKTEFGNWVYRAMEMVFLRIMNPLYHLDFIFNLTPLKKEWDYIRMKMYEMSSQVVNENKLRYNNRIKSINEGIHVEETTKRKALLDYLVEHTYSQDNSLLSNEELRQEVITFMVAGSDTTANTNSFIFMVLGMFPEVQEKVYHEVIDVIGPDRSVSYKDLIHFPYLECVIKETLRLFPVAPYLVRGVEEDIDIGDYIMPGGSSVFMSVLNIQRNPKYWPDPLKFKPERFMSPNKETIVPGAFIPFAWGPRNCIGFKYAMMAMKTFMATVIRKYSIKSEYQNIEDIKLESSVVLRPKNGYNVEIRKRV